MRKNLVFQIPNLAFFIFWYFRVMIFSGSAANLPFGAPLSLQKSLGNTVKNSLMSIVDNLTQSKM